MGTHTSDVWLNKVYDSYWTAIFHRLAGQKYGTFTDARQLVEDARQRLAMGLAKLAEGGDARPLSESYVQVAFKAALVDVMRERYGRRQPRKWLANYGAIGQRLFDLYCLMRLKLAEILEALGADSEFAEQPEAEEDKVRFLLREMDAREECAGRPVEEVPMDRKEGDGEAQRLQLSSPSPGPEDNLREERAAALKAYLFNGMSRGTPEPFLDPLQKVLEQVGDRSLALDDEECFVLRSYLDRIPEARVGELLGGLTVRQVRYRRQTAIGKLRTLLQEAGIAYDDLLPG